MRLSCLTLVVFALGCGGDGGGGTPPPAAVFTTLSLTPLTATIPVGGTVQLTATPRDQNDAAMSGIPAASFSTSDASRASVSQSGLVTAVAAGTATITASLTAQGQTRSASTAVTVTPPTREGQVTVGDNFFQPATVTVIRDASGAVVRWNWSGQNPHNVTFDAGAPNSATQTSGTFSRTFTAAGSFTYFCTVHGRSMSGTVVVQ